MSGTLAEWLRFAGEKHDDPSTAWVYLRARQYDPEIGRFVSADPVLGSLRAPQTLNRYAYVVNNPLRYADPTGEFWFKNPIGDWWDSLDSNTRGLILIAAAVALIVVTGGVGSVLVGAYAAGTVGAIIGTALVNFAAGAALGALGSIAVASGVSAITGQTLSIETIGQAAFTGAILGGVSAVAPMAGGSFAHLLGRSATGLLATSTRLAIVGTTATGLSYAMGERDPAKLAFAGMIGAGGAYLGGKVFPTKSMTIFRQASYFSPRTSSAFSQALLGKGGPNAQAIVDRAFIFRPLYGGATAAIWYAYVSWQDRDG